jgi:hypothetical protein
MWGKCWDTTNQIAEKTEKKKLKAVLEAALVNEELPTYILDKCNELCFRCTSFK